MNNLLWCLLICMILLPIVIYFIQKNNMDYYKLNGRDNSEVEAWLKTRKWYNIFKYNIQQEVLNEHKNDDGSIVVDKNVEKEIDDRVNEIVTGQMDTLTIANAFSWRETNEGTVYWGKREHEFLAWYFGQYIDLHLFK